MFRLKRLILTNSVGSSIEYAFRINRKLARNNYARKKTPRPVFNTRKSRQNTVYRFSRIYIQFRFINIYQQHSCCIELYVVNYSNMHLNTSSVRYLRTNWNVRVYVNAVNAEQIFTVRIRQIYCRQEVEPISFSEHLWYCGMRQLSWKKWIGYDA